MTLAWNTQHEESARTRTRWTASDLACWLEHCRPGQADISGRWHITAPDPRSYGLSGSDLTFSWSSSCLPAGHIYIRKPRYEQRSTIMVIISCLLLSRPPTSLESWRLGLLSKLRNTVSIDRSSPP